MEEPPHHQAARMLSGMTSRSHPHDLKENRISLKTPLGRNSIMLVDLMQKATKCAQIISAKGTPVTAKPAFRYADTIGVYFQRAPPGRKPR